MDEQTPPIASAVAAPIAAKAATIEITLPPAPAQSIEQAKRIVTIAGSSNDGSHDVAIGVAAPILINAALDAQVSVSVAEVLANGRQSPPCTVSFTPYERIEAIAADPAGFVVKVCVALKNQIPGLRPGI